ncbi:MAG TPA: sulfotransferase [Caulobacteraceae bacterium]
MSRSFAPHAALGPRGVRQLEVLAHELAPLGPPIIVYNVSHSGSRLLATLLGRLGVFMGSHLNESEDSLDVFELVRHLVEAHAPDYSRLFADGDGELPDRVLEAFESHLQSWRPGGAWGWKLPETAHVLPVISRLFPQARCIHLVRDGRDVAFSPFLSPKHPFWRKIYFNDDQICSWCGHAMTQRAYRSHGHVFNAARWVNGVTLGRAHGAMLGERYLEMRYEALVEDPAGELARLADFLGLEQPAGAFDGLEVSRGSVGKWRRQPAREVAEVRAVLEPTLASFGYAWDAALPPGRARLLSKLFGGRGRGVSAERNTEPGGLGGLFRVRDRR